MARIKSKLKRQATSRTTIRMDQASLDDWAEVCTMLRLPSISAAIRYGGRELLKYLRESK